MRKTVSTYVSILRGINVSGKNLIKMVALRTMFEKLGFYNVTTYLQSGNVIFAGKNVDNNQLAEIISQQIEKDFGFNVAVIVLTVKELKQIIAHNPFVNDLNKQPSFLHVTILSAIPEPYEQDTIEEKRVNGEEIYFTDHAVYLYCPNGYGKTKITNNFLEKRLKVRATTRNWKTANELLHIANQTMH